MEINIVAVILAALVPFFLGYMWYTMIFNKPWMKEVGITEGDAVKGTDIKKQLIGSFILEILMAVVLSIVLGKDADASMGATKGFLVGLIVAFAFGVNYFFEGKTLKHWSINAGYNIILLTLMGLIIGAM
ncbi:MAG: DUF1761 domain-containing protein [Candidatus Dojkabacteria bacterium]